MASSTRPQKIKAPLAMRSTVAQQAWNRSCAGPMADRRREVRDTRSGGRRRAIADSF